MMRSVVVWVTTTILMLCIILPDLVHASGFPSHQTPPANGRVADEPITTIVFTSMVIAWVGVFLIATGPDPGSGAGGDVCTDTEVDEGTADDGGGGGAGRLPRVARAGSAKGTSEERSYSGGFVFPNPGNTIVPDSLSGYVPHTGYSLYDSTSFGTLDANHLKVSVHNANYRANVLAPGVGSDSVAYDIVHRSFFTLVKQVPGSGGANFTLNLGMNGLSFSTTDSTGTLGQVRFFYQIESKELGVHFYSRAYVIQGRAPVIYGDIPPSSFSVAPGRASLSSYTTSKGISIPSTVDTLHFTLTYYVAGRGLKGAPVGTPEGSQSPRVFLGSPNPNPGDGGQASVDVDLPRNVHARIRLINVEGRTMGLIFDGRLDSGTQRVPFRLDECCGDLPSGIYFIHLDAEGITRSRKLVLAR